MAHKAKCHLPHPPSSWAHIPDTHHAEQPRTKQPCKAGSQTVHLYCSMPQLSKAALNKIPNAKNDDSIYTSHPALAAVQIFAARLPKSHCKQLHYLSHRAARSVCFAFCSRPYPWSGEKQKEIHAAAILLSVSLLSFFSSLHQRVSNSANT